MLVLGRVHYLLGPEEKKEMMKQNWKKWRYSEMGENHFGKTSSDTASEDLGVLSGKYYG